MSTVKLTKDHHLLTRNLKLNDNYISNDGGDEGITIQDDGDVIIHGDTRLYLNDAGGEYLNSDGNDLDINSGRDIILTANRGIVFTPVGEITCGSSTVGFTAQTGEGNEDIDWGEGNKFHLEIGGNTTINFDTNPSKPCNLLLKIKQVNGGSHTITWAVTSGTIYWAGGGILNTGEPTLTTTDDKTDILSFYFDGTNYFGVATLDFDTT